MDGWYYRVFGSDFGPITFDELVELAKNHSLSSDDEVRFGAQGNWRRAGSIGQLMAHLPYTASQIVISTAVPQLVSASPAEFLPGKGSPLRSQESPSEEGQGSVAAVEAPVDSNWSHSANAVVQEKSPIQQMPIPSVAAEVPPQVEDKWWCKIQDREYGPVELFKIVEWATAGRLHPDDFVRLGREPYVKASEFTDLFPKKSTPVSSVETKAEIKVPSDTQVMAAKPHVVESPKPPTPSASSGNESPAAEKPAATAPIPKSAMSGAGVPPAAGAKRPPVPVKAASVGASQIKDLILGPIGMGIGGTLLLGALIYFALTNIQFSEPAYVKDFKDLQESYKKMTAMRDKNAKPDELKPVAEQVAKLGKEIADKNKGSKDAKQKKVYYAANKMKDLAKEELGDSPTDLEKTITRSLSETSKLLGFK